MSASAMQKTPSTPEDHVLRVVTEERLLEIRKAPARLRTKHRELLHGTSYVPRRLKFTGASIDDAQKTAPLPAHPEAATAAGIAN